MNDWRQRMRWLVDKLNEASNAYYNEDREIMSNLEYDRLYDELVCLEKENKYILPDSPTQHVGYQVVDKLEKVEHPSPMLSLNKTKDIIDLEKFLANQEGILSWKLDGLTIVVTYRNGRLEQAVTRGNGYIGEDVTHNAFAFINLPKEVTFKEKLIIRGEAVISYPDFYQINRQISEEDAKYKNPRNLCSGSVRQLDSRVAARRSIRFMPFELVEAEGIKFSTVSESFEWLLSLGFEVVPYVLVDKNCIKQEVKEFEELIEEYVIPSDGLVLRFNNIAYGDSLGSTDKFPNHSIAFKWKDETATTKLIDVEWNTSRTGLINPVAIFEPVELEGTTVTRATLHNVSVMEGLELGIGDEITVYKANKIIPAIDDNMTRSGTMRIPDTCPACGEKAIIVQENESKILMCKNPMCQAQAAYRIIRFTSRDCMNINGLGESSISLMVNRGILNGVKDIYTLANKRNVLLTLPKWGEKKVNSLLTAIEKSKHCKLESYIAALSIPGVGTSQAKVLASVFDNWNDFENAMQSRTRLQEIDGFGESTANSIREWYRYVYLSERLNELTELMEFETPIDTRSDKSMDGLVFVITGSLVHFKNRNELVNFIEGRGGKVAGSVTSKTNYLINNDIESTSGKNRKARELGVEILSEENLLKKF